MSGGGGILLQLLLLLRHAPSLSVDHNISFSGRGSRIQGPWNKCTADCCSTGIPPIHVRSCSIWCHTVASQSSVTAVTRGESSDTASGNGSGFSTSCFLDCSSWTCTSLDLVRLFSNHESMDPTTARQLSQTSLPRDIVSIFCIAARPRLWISLLWTSTVLSPVTASESKLSFDRTRRPYQIEV